MNTIEIFTIISSHVLFALFLLILDLFGIQSEQDNIYFLSCRLLSFLIYGIFHENKKNQMIVKLLYTFLK